MIGRLPGVTAVQDTGTVGVNVYRSPPIPAINTNALTVNAASLVLPAAAGTSIARGFYLNAATAREPVAVLGAAAAAYLGIDRIWPSERIWVGAMWFYVAGILKPDALVPGIDTSVLIGYPAAEQYLGFDGHPSTIFVRAQDSQVTAVDNLLAAQANPQNPGQVQVSQPSSALTAQADTAGAFNGLFLGLGAVALLVGAIGVANIMVISVLERRSEIGLRRALGATKGHIRIQFLSEAILLALLGGAAGAAALLIGATAGLLPALKAARMPPTQALWSLSRTQPEPGQHSQRSSNYPATSPAVPAAPGQAPRADQPGRRITIRIRKELSASRRESRAYNGSVRVLPNLFHHSA